MSEIEQSKPSQSGADRERLGGETKVRLRMQHLRCEGNFDAALLAAREYLELKKSNPNSSSDLVEDAVNAVTTLELIVGLPKKDQEVIAGAYRLGSDIEGLFADDEYSKAAELAVKQRGIFEQYHIDEHPLDVASFRFAVMLRDVDKIRGALEIYRRACGEADERVLEALEVLGWVLYQRREFVEMDQVQRQAVEIARQLYGPENPRVASNLDILAIARDGRASALEARIKSLGVEGRFAEALGVAKELLGVREADPSAKRFQVADAERNVSSLESMVALPGETQEELAEAYGLYEATYEHWRNAQFDDAVSATEKQLGIFKKVFGNDHLEVSRSRNNLGLLFQVKADYQTAEPLLRASLAIFRQALGPNHPAVAGSLGNLATVLYKKGDRAGAEPLYRESLGIVRQALGPNHPHVAGSLSNLATFLYEQGDYAGAEPLLRESLEIRRQALGPGHPAVAESLNNLGNLLSDKGDYGGAEALLRESLEIRRQALGPDHPEVARSLNNLGNLLSRKGDRAGAEPLLRESLEIRRKRLDPDHPDVAESVRNLGLLLKAKGDSAGAE